MDGVLVPAVPSRLLLWGRAVVLATVALATGVVSHTAGGGRLPAPPALAVLLLVAVVLSAGFLTTRATTGRLVLLVVAGQTLTHAALSGLAGHRGGPAAAPAAGPGSGLAAPDPTALGGGRRTGNLYDHYASSLPTAPGRGGGSGGESGGWLSHQVEHLVEQGPVMVLAHVCGAVVLGLFLAVGERALWRLLLLWAARHLVVLAGERILRQAVAVAAGQRVRPVPAGDPHPAVAGSQVLDRDTDRRRGPPLVLAA